MVSIKEKRISGKVYLYAEYSFRLPNGKVKKISKIVKRKEDANSREVKDYFIVGKLDRVDTGKDNKISVIDYKISDYKKGRNDTFKNNSRDLHEFQIKVYIAAFSEIYEKPVEDITGFLLYLGDGTKKPVYLKSSEVKQLKKDIGDDINKISGNDFNMDHKGHCKNCSYRDFCRFMSSF